MTVTVDRPLGSTHPEHPGLRYPVNYGYVAGVLSGNFDITDLFIDSTLKIGGRDLNKFACFLEKLSASIGSREVNVVMTVSADKDELPASVRSYIL